jgi:hypothetical protein
VIEGCAVKLTCHTMKIVPACAAFFAESQSAWAIPNDHCSPGQVLDGEYLSAEPIFPVSPNA